ncbi:hypothetical protein C5610_10820 [Idiomarina sp. OT37-5b]|uniref:DUF429 domain-containing protein n=1 Tax=Idiomarina sp. OT37-5b TaxID=2100422 RepID=UPI000CF90E26|nr:DUF429 domain-containing protein [Idiomarina sp. OT37-5b]AVJ56731.1 hypothetical protein C5610_10820 [Idiomarina sp. OT37-5b]
MNQIIKCTYPTGKIFVSFCIDSEGDDFSSFDWIAFRKDLSELPKIQQSDYCIRREVLWEQTDCDKQTLMKKFDEFINQYQSHNSEIGYNLPQAASDGCGKQLDGWRVGMDGCKAGWFYIASCDLETRFGIVVTVAELFELFDNVAGVFIDIPIGLYDSGAQARACDKLARQALKSRGSTVFPAPVRPCLQAVTYEEACSISAELTGKRLSQQAFHIFRKIKEVDELLQQRPELKEVVREVHPELGFCMLNSNAPLFTKKKSSEGIEERLRLLEQQIKGAREIYERALTKYPRKVLARDDIVDAMMCLCIAKAPYSERGTLPETIDKDSKGIEMAMHFYLPFKHQTR